MCPSSLYQIAHNGRQRHEEAVNSFIRNVPDALRRIFCCSSVRFIPYVAKLVAASILPLHTMKLVPAFCSLAATQLAGLVIAQHVVNSESLHTTFLHNLNPPIDTQILTSVADHDGLSSEPRIPDFKTSFTKAGKDHHDDLADTNDIFFGTTKIAQTGTVTSSIGKEIPTTAVSATIVQYAEMYTYQNCSMDNADSGDPAFGDGPVNTNINNVEDCANWCYTGGSDAVDAYLLFGVEYGSQCRCANEMANQGFSDACNIPCLNSPDEICGGSGALNVYILNQYAPAMSSQLPSVSTQTTDSFTDTSSFTDSTVFATNSTTTYIGTFPTSSTTSVTSQTTISSEVVATSSDNALQPTKTATSGIHSFNASVTSSSSSASYVALATFTDQPRCSAYYIDSAGDRSRIYCNASLQAPDLSTGPAEDFESCIAICGEVNKRNAGDVCIAAQFYNGTDSAQPVCALKMDTQNSPSPTVSVMLSLPTSPDIMTSGAQSSSSLAFDGSETAIGIILTQPSTSERFAVTTADASQASPTSNGDGAASTANIDQPTESTSSGDGLDSTNPDDGDDAGADSDADGPADTNEGDLDGNSDLNSIDNRESISDGLTTSSMTDIRRSLSLHEFKANLDLAQHAAEERRDPFEGQSGVGFYDKRYFTLGNLVVLNAPFNFVALFMANVDQPAPNDPTPASITSAAAGSSTTFSSSESSNISSSPTSMDTELYVGTTTIIVTSTISRYVCHQEARVALSGSHSRNPTSTPAK